MQITNIFRKLEPVYWIIFTGAVIKFALQVYIAPGYGYFGDELYTMALSHHLAFGYVDLPPLVPAIMAASRVVLGDSMLAFHIVPALAGAVMLVFICLITLELGGKRFAVITSVLLCISVPVWLSLDSIFCYDSIDQMVLAVFLYTLVRFIKSGNATLWLLLGLIAGIACMTKMTLLFWGPGFLAALLLSKYRKYLLTPWPYLGGLICLVIISPYIFWEIHNHWPTVEYWMGYGTLRTYKADIPQYLTNIIVYMNPFLPPVWIFGLYRILRRFNGLNFRFLGYLFLFTLSLLYFLHATPRLFIGLFIPLIAAASICMEETVNAIRWSKIFQVAVAIYLVTAGILVMPSSLPILPVSALPEVAQSSRQWFEMVREFVGGNSNAPFLLCGRLGWEEITRAVAGVFDQLPEEDREVAGIYTDSYMPAGAIDFYGPRYGLPHAVSGSLNYNLWGPGYSWDVMIIVSGGANNMAMFFNECEQKTMVTGNELTDFYHPRIFVCRNPRVPAEKIWSGAKQFR
jgi:hypothetical protein